MKNIFTMKFVPVVLIAGCSVLSGCQKEALVNPKSTRATTATPAAVASTESASINSPFSMTGRLGDEIISITGAPTSYATLVTVDNNGNHWYHDNYDDNDGGNNSNTGYITGVKWVSNGPAGIVVTHGSFELRKLSVRVYVAPITSELPSFFYDMVEPSYYSFAYNNDPDNGAYVTLLDKNNVLWTSNGDQDGSTFQITSRGANKGSSAVVSGVITCKMYDGNGNVKTFTGATFNAEVGL